MKALLLAAGYATRLYPLTRDFPKPLLPVAGRPIVDHLLEKLERVSDVDAVYVVTNHRFVKHFRDWAAGAQTPLPITVIDDGTVSNEERLGAVGDIAFALEYADLAGDEVLVLAGDNLFDFELTDFVRTYRSHSDAVAAVTVHVLKDVQALQRTGVATLDDLDRVVHFAEKPREPQSHWAVPPFYIFKPGIKDVVEDFLKSGGNPDAPGYFLEWLVKKAPVYAYRFPGRRYDIGDLESYLETQAIFESREGDGRG